MSKSETVIFKPSKGGSEFKIVLDQEMDTVWITQNQMTALFEKSKATISEHIKNIFFEKEIEEISTVRDFRTVQKEGNREIARVVTHYNLDVIISVGYRVKSKVGIEFRKWATQKLKDYLIKGYVINHDVLKTFDNSPT